MTNDLSISLVPFGALQLFVILLASWLAYRYSKKGIMLIAIALPVVLGTGLLFGLAHTKANTAPLLVGYYLLSFSKYIYNRLDRKIF